MPMPLAMPMHTARATPPDTARDPRPAVLLLHGLCANPLELMPLARTLREAGYLVEAPALPGYGVAVERGGRRAPVARFEDWVALATAHFDVLAARHELVAIGGLSMGSVLALALAMKRPAAALMLLSTSLHFDGWNVSPWRRLLPLAYVRPLRQWLSFRERPPYGIKNERLRAWVAQAMVSEHVSAAGADQLSAASLYQASRMIRTVRAGLPSITAPTLVLHASEDDVSGPRSVLELQQRLGSTPEVHWFHHSYHMLTLDNERSAVTQTARDFLRSRLPVAAVSPVAALFPTSLREDLPHEQHA
ncbi:alpha/beta hydrolase [Roseateles amylovorans]|uniref:Alpha/beta fold hydrolase n=1 Tax=Roseateles amylovorans TaxID=2978473 RepID=A0ABY6B1F6_9BURK|nr:alpha/beta fold hydrolase [Roseateles amylovorans]UXH79230.1 alpha/beta fold hydrolase [Roseateles amylovorans]